MQRFTCVLVAVLAVANAAPYGSHGGHGGHGGHHQQSYGAKSSYGAPAPSHSGIVTPTRANIQYHIPPPSHYNLSPASHGLNLYPVDAHSITGAGVPSPLIGKSSNPSAIAAAASANVALNGGKYKLLVVPSFHVPNAVGPEPAVPRHIPAPESHASNYAPSIAYSAPAVSYGAPSVSYGAPAPSYSAPAPSYSAPAPSYSAPAPSYSAPAPSYSAPAPSYSAPAASY